MATKTCFPLHLQWPRLKQESRDNDLLTFWWKTYAVCGAEDRLGWTIMYDK
jgi:hypothetical protein